MQTRGLRVDGQKAKEHKERLQQAREEARLTIVNEPKAAGAIARANTASHSALDSLYARRSEATKAANRDLEDYESFVCDIRRSWAAGDRSRTIKSLGPKPKKVRVTSFNKEINKIKYELKTRSEFNPNSDQQVGWLLYDILGLPKQFNVGDEGKASVTVDKKALARLARLKAAEPYRGVLAALRQHGHVAQLLSTFIQPCFDAAGGTVERLYFDIGLHRTATGRLASGIDTTDKAGISDINAQNQPKELRDIFISEAGFYFVQVDWSRVEWLLTLYFAGDREGWQRALAGEDQHRRLASYVFGCQYETVTDTQRGTAKKATHGINYGMGERRLADEMGIGVAEAKEIIATYKKAFPLVASYRESQIEKAKKQKYLQTVYGWRRWYWAVDDSNKGEVLAFEPQATGADMCKIRLPSMDEAAKAMGGFLSNTTHDSFLVQVPETLDKKVAKEHFKQVAEQPFRLLGNLAFPADVKDGSNWKECS